MLRVQVSSALPFASIWMISIWSNWTVAVDFANVLRVPAAEPPATEPAAAEPPAAEPPAAEPPAAEPPAAMPQRDNLLARFFRRQRWKPLASKSTKIDNTTIYNRQ